MKNKQNISEEALIRKFQKGDSKALVPLVKRYHKLWCALAYEILQDADLAKDVAQEAWKVIIASLPAISATVKFKAWGARIVKNKSIDELRRQLRLRARQQALLRTGFNWEVNEAERIGKEERYRAVLKVYKTLSEEHRQVLRLFYVDKYSLKTMASLLGISEGTVKSRLFHAREKIKKNVKVT